jgi:phosphoenolpyruvate carboxykinase (GTP)
MPTLDGIDFDNLEMDEADKANLLRVDVEGWLQELPSIEEYYDSFGNHVPDELRQQLKALKERLESEKQAVA